MPASQIATLTNDYQFTGLSVTKQVQTDATAGQFGPFTFSLICTSATGTPVVFDDQGTKELTFTLEAGQTWTAPADRIPCLLYTSPSPRDGLLSRMPSSA